MQALARKSAALDIGEGWFGAIAISMQNSESIASLASQKFSGKVPERSELSAAIAETIYCIVAQALVFIAATSPEVCPHKQIRDKTHLLCLNASCLAYIYNPA